MKRVAKTEDDPIVEVPPIVRVSIVAVEPTLTVVVALDVEHVRVAIGVGLSCIASSMTPRLENLSMIPALNSIRDLQSHKAMHQVSSFLKFLHAPPYPKP